MYGGMATWEVGSQVMLAPVESKSLDQKLLVGLLARLCRGAGLGLGGGGGRSGGGGRVRGGGVRRSKGCTCGRRWCWGWYCEEDWGSYSNQPINLEHYSGVSTASATLGRHGWRGEGGRGCVIAGGWSPAEEGP